MSRLGRVARTAAAVAAGAAGAYGAYAVAAWYRYGRAGPPDAAGSDALLDAFMPVSEVVERRQIRVAAPAATVLAAAREMDLFGPSAVRAIFAGRALALRAHGPAAPPEGLAAQLLAAGWAVLAEVPERELVFGTVTRPWEPDVAFRTVPASEFAAFAEPGYVKIAFTLRADPLGPGASIFRSETRVATTDAAARATFRRYWAAFSAGIHLIRIVMLRALKREAERRARS